MPQCVQKHWWFFHGSPVSSESGAVLRKVRFKGGGPKHLIFERNGIWAGLRRPESLLRKSCGSLPSPCSNNPFHLQLVTSNLRICRLGGKGGLPCSPTLIKIGVVTADSFPPLPPARLTSVEYLRTFSATAVNGEVTGHDRRTVKHARVNVGCFAYWRCL